MIIALVALGMITVVLFIRFDMALLNGLPPAVLVAVAVLSGIVIVVCYGTGERPRWR